MYVIYAYTSSILKHVFRESQENVKYINNIKLAARGVIYQIYA